MGILSAKFTHVLSSNAIQAICSAYTANRCLYFENFFLSGDEEPLSCMSVSTNILKEADTLRILDADRAEPNVCDSDNINPCDFPYIDWVKEQSFVRDIKRIIELFMRGFPK